jgi:hypothetical protein
MAQLMLPVSSRTTGSEQTVLPVPVSCRTAGIDEAVVDKNEKAEKRDEDGVEDGRDLGQEGGGGQVQQAAAIHAHQQQGLSP